MVYNNENQLYDELILVSTGDKDHTYVHARTFVCRLINSERVIFLLDSDSDKEFRCYFDDTRMKEADKLLDH